ncbi:hypothetical protein EYR36_005637 [Pleurotus pulmonarius]|nr:hypothetical protein EYR36_005637 [Pleurotus pulmonarius]
MKPAFLLTLLSGSLVFAYSQDSDLRALLVSPSFLARLAGGIALTFPVGAAPLAANAAQMGDAAGVLSLVVAVDAVPAVRVVAVDLVNVAQLGHGVSQSRTELHAALTAKPVMHARRKDTQSVRTSPIIVAVRLIVLHSNSHLISLFIARGQQCYRDGSNAVRCRNPPPPDPPKQDPPKQDPPPKQDAPKQDTPKQDPPSPSPNPPKQDPTTSTTTTTRVSTTTRTPTTTFAASSTTRLVFPTSTEAPAAGYINQVVSLTDPRIAYYGASWVESTSTCFSNIRSRKASGGSHSVRFDFLGTGVFINVAKNVNSGIFSVTILSDTNTTVGSTIEIDAYATSTESSCGIGFAKVGLSPSTYTLVVDILGVSPQASSGSVGTFELLDFVATVPQSGQLNTGPGNGATSIHKDILTSCIIAVSSVFILASLQRLYAS